MDIILLERISRLGNVGDVVKVKNGFARNFLFPEKKALRATDSNKKLFEGKRAVLEKQTHAHTEFVPEDFDELRRLGVGDEAITDALYVGYLFNIINRMADALRFEIGPPAAFEVSAKALLTRGYKL